MNGDAIATTIRLPKSFHKWLRKEALNQGVSFNQFVLTALYEREQKEVAR